MRQGRRPETKIEAQVCKGAPPIHRADHLQEATIALQRGQTVQNLELIQC